MHHVVVIASIAYMIRKNTIVQTYGDYPNYDTPDDKMIDRMLHLPPEKNRLNNEQHAQSSRVCTTE